MALRGIQEYIARDANNIARVEDEDEGQYILVSPKQNHPILEQSNFILF